jgi:hypothetical protein
VIVGLEASNGDRHHAPSPSAAPVGA